MPIPVAKEIQHNIMTQAARVKAQGPIAADDSIARSGAAFKSALNNAEEGFAKLYLANQRADAIDAYQEYEQELETLRNGAEIDPETGLPQGFLNYKGDQINQENLDAKMDQIGAAKAKLDNKLKGSVPDIRDEYARKADTEMFGTTNALNAHYLKGKWEHSKNSALAENENIIQNKPALTPAEAQAYYNTFKANHFNYTYDEKESELLAEKDMEKLVDANTRRILTDHPDGQTYADAKSYVKSLSGKPGFGKTTADAKIHKLDLDSGKFELTKLQMTPEKMKDFLNKNTTHLDELEKATLIATSAKHNGNSSGSGNDTDTNAWFDIVTRLATAQPDFLSSENEYGVYAKNALSGDIKQVSDAEATQFRTDWLEFIGDVIPALAQANADELEEKGLLGVVDERFLNIAKSKGQLMKQTIANLDSALKKGNLGPLEQKQISSLMTVTNRLQNKRYDQYQVRQRYNELKIQAEPLVKKFDKGEHTEEDVRQAIDLAAEMQSIYGSGAVGYDDKTLGELQSRFILGIGNSMATAFTDPSEITLGSRIYQRFAALGDTMRFKWNNPGKDASFVAKNNQMIMDWLRPSQTTKKDEYGRRSIVPAIFKTYVDVSQQMMSPDGLTLVHLSDNGEPDPTRPILKKQMFAIDGRREDGTMANSNRKAFQIATEFSDYLNKKNGTKRYSNFTEIDYDNLAAEDKEYLRELTKQRFLEENGKAGYTCLDSNIDVDNVLLADVNNRQTEPSNAFVGGSTGAFWVENTPEMQAKKRAQKTPFIGPIGRSIADMDFSGGVADPSQEAILVQQGYASYEDFAYKTGALTYPGMEQEDAKKNNVYLMLASIAPYGTDTHFVKAQSAQKKALGKIVDILKQENPDMKSEVFFEKGVPTYDISDKGYEDIARIYEKVRSSIIADKRELYYTSRGKRIAEQKAKETFKAEE